MQHQPSTPSLEQLKTHVRTQAKVKATSPVWLTFERRLDQHFPNLAKELGALYGEHKNYVEFMQDLLTQAFGYAHRRPKDMQALDEAREADPRWFQSQKMLGGVCYVDLYAGNFQGLKAKIPYFKELGLTYLHLMPPYKCPEVHNDGGYAVSSYRETNPAIGTIDDLRDLSKALRKEGISLVLDFIFNHTSDEHAWAKACFGRRPRRTRTFITSFRIAPSQTRTTRPCAKSSQMPIPAPSHSCRTAAGSGPPSTPSNST
jgi:amylosucrase